MSKEAFFSIIIINLNNEVGLKKTLDSLASQTISDYEIIFIDGGSSDESLAIAEGYEDLIQQKLIGQDTGIYNAMNIGISTMRGEYALFLNSGDCLHSDNVLEKAKEILRRSPEKLLFGYAEICSEDNFWLFPPEKFALSLESLRGWLKIREPNHQSMFFPESFCKNRKYNESLTIIADKDFKRCALESLDFEFLDCPVVSFEIGGISSEIRHFDQVKKYAQNYYQYYLIQGKGVKSTLLFFTSSLKILIKFVSQRIAGEAFWKFMKKMVNYPVA